VVRLEGREDVLVGIAKEPVCQLPIAHLLRLPDDLDLLIDELQLSLEMNVDVPCPAVRAEQGRGVDAVGPGADVAGDLPEEVFAEVERLRGGRRA